MIKRQKISDIISNVLLGLMVLFLVLYFIVGEIRLPSERTVDKSDCKVADLDWVWEKNDGTSTHIKLPNDFDVDYKEQMRISTTLPKQLDYDSIMLWNKGAKLKVYVGGKLRYEFDTKDSRWIGKAASYTYNFIDLKPEDAGKKLTLELVWNTASAGNIGEVYVGDKASELLYAIAPYQIHVVAALFLMLLGLACIILDLVILKRTKTCSGIIYLGISVIVTCFWVITNIKIRQFIFPNASIVRDCAFFAAAIMLSPYLHFVDKVQDEAYHKAYLGAEYLNFACFTTFLLRYLIQDRLYFETMYLSMGIAFVVIAGTLIRDMVYRRIKNYSIIAKGCAAMLCAGILQMVYYIIWPHYVYGSLIVLAGLACLIVFSIIYSINYIFEIDKAKRTIEKKVENITVQTMESFAKMVDAKDKYTSGHCERVALYSTMIAKKYGYDEKSVERLKYIALLHDIGKIGIPDSIINKTGKLTDEEYETIKNHSRLGYEILSHISEIEGLESGAHYHHERYDGKGYPEGLAGEKIPEIARIIAVADSYDAMTSNRSYRGYLSQEKVISEIKNNIGKQFDPKFARIMLAIILEDKEYKLHE